MTLKTAYAAGLLNLRAIAKGGRIVTIRDVEAEIIEFAPSYPRTQAYENTYLINFKR